MNVNDSCHTCKVVSKYFSGKSAMDESITDFQEKKTNTTGPKNTLKSNTFKNKPKKPPKRLRGQKDIRTVLKKKNELITYAKEFDEVCKQSGVDVDSEQLQLAIALSKSLQKTDSTSDSSTSQTFKPGSQARVSKIRTTLQQYGFKLPEIKIIPIASRKAKKALKKYKLLSITEAERRQIITDKYSQFLLENLENTKINETDINFDVTKLQLFHKATSISYECMKDIDTFYVDNLLEKSYSAGCLLRNWSDIPGRPESPKLMKDSNMDFSEIECSQKELDVALSGSLKSARTIFKTKHNLKPASIHNECNNSKNIDSNVAEKLHDNSVIVIEDETSDKVLVVTPKVLGDVIENVIEVADLEPDSLTRAQCRSHSPDIFDDDLSVTDCTVTKEIQSPKIKVAEESNNFMDLTECVKVPYKDMRTENSQTPISQLSQKSDTTKRKSCDFMEMTECIVSSSQPILTNYENIDLTQSPDQDSNNADKIENMDLTQSSNTSDEFPFVNIGSQMQKSLDDTIILNDIELEINNDTNNPDIVELDNEELDLTQGRYANPVESINQSNHACSFDEDSHDQPDKRKELSEADIDVENFKLIPKDPIWDTESNDIDLTQSSETDEDDKTVNSLTATPKISFISSRLGKKDDVSIDYDELNDSIDKSDAICRTNTQNTSISNKSSNSIVYDITNDEVQQNSSENTSKYMVSDFSQNSEVFEIVDQEFDYSLRKSRIDPISMDNFDEGNEEEILYDNGNEITSSSSKSPEDSPIKSKCHVPNSNFIFGGISILDNFSNLSRFRKTMDTNNKSIENNFTESTNDSYLPVVDLKTGINNETPSQKEPVTTPIKETNKNVVPFKTPVNKDYIIKIDEVTPMVDYESMSTPERNRELEKYGLKPFKRKRAIQLLTHLYNQTHPIIESYENEELPSPSKRQKSNKSTENSPIKKLKSPRKPSEKNKCVETQEVAYEESNALPIIKEIYCLEDDWIFQKREKAKVHSCRVPLHIAFHNYVFSRRELREAILRYEPINIDVIHKDLVGYGHRYDPKDLLKFMDKKCITVKTTDNNIRNNKR